MTDFVIPYWTGQIDSHQSRGKTQAPFVILVNIFVPCCRGMFYDYVMTDNQNENQKQDWGKLATEALDLWQNHLNALASDPKVKEEVTRFVTPMTQMFSQWTEMMQSGLQGMAGFTPPTDPSQAAAAPTDTAVDQETAPATSEAAPTDGAQADVQPDATADIRGDSGTESGLAPAPVVSVFVQQPEPAASPATSSVPTAEPSVRGRTASSDGTRDLAQLASRLAQLERELDTLRPKNKRPAADGTVADVDAAADGTVQRVAGTD